MNEKKNGKVYLVGAGPGLAGLITFRGLQAIVSADAVCFDALVDPTLIVSLPARVERHYVGKRAGRHSMPQREIEKLLLRLAKEGKIVARLKGGDPFIFGRGGEEALALRKEGVPFEVIPGVTAASAAAAYAGIPLTHREIASRVTFFTAHEMAGKEEESRLSFRKLAETDNGTLVGYMGIRRLSDTVDGLLKAGMDPKTPAAIVERGATTAQRVIRADLAGLPDRSEEEKVQPPGLLIVGGVAALADSLSWYEPGPLRGKRVLVTRPAAQAGRMYDLLTGLGAVVVPAPAIRAEPFFDEDGWKSFGGSLDNGGWIVFTSENGVRWFAAGLRGQGLDWRALGKFRIAVIGTSTRAVLGSLGLNADLVPEEFTGGRLAEELSSRIRKGETVVRVRGDLGEPVVEETLRQAGGNVLPLRVYTTITEKLGDGVRAWVEEAPLDFISFTSGSTVTAFVEQWGHEQALKMAEQARVASIGPVTSETALKAGFKVAIEAEVHTVEGLVGAIVAQLSLPG